jgi:hypothetical protein
MKDDDTNPPTKKRLRSSTSSFNNNSGGGETATTTLDNGNNNDNVIASTDNKNKNNDASDVAAVGETNAANANTQNQCIKVHRSIEDMICYNCILCKMPRCGRCFICNATSNLVEEERGYCIRKVSKREEMNIYIFLNASFDTNYSFWFSFGKNNTIPTTT